MKYRFALILLLPYFSSCTAVVNDYYDSYREPARVRVESPYVRRYHQRPEVTVSRPYHRHEDARVTVREPGYRQQGRDTHSRQGYVRKAENSRFHDNHAHD